MSEELHQMNPDTWIRVCPRCLSTLTDLHLYGRYSQQLYKCIECEYVGIDFFYVNLPILEKMRATRAMKD